MLEMQNLGDTHQIPISTIKYIKRFENLPDERLAIKALKQLMVDDAKGHYNWFSQTTNLVKENNIEIDKDSHFIRNKRTCDHLHDTVIS